MTGTSDVLASLNTGFPTGPPTKQTVLERRVGYYPRQWRRRWPADLDMPDFITNSGDAMRRVSRAQLLHQSSEIHSQAAALSFFVDICGWGSGWGARSTARCANALQDSALATKLLRARDLALTDPVAAYSSLRPGGANRVYGLGPAFFTKWLHFSAFEQCTAITPPLILDARVAKILGWRSTGWASPGYGFYLAYVNDVLAEWCPAEPAFVVEYAMFILGGQ